MRETPRREDRERDRVLARAKRYPYAAPETSYAITTAGRYELVGLGPDRPGTGLASGVRARHAESGEELPFAAIPADDLDSDSLDARLPALAYGANRTAEALERKRALPGFPAEESILVLRARLYDLDVVYSAHVSPYGSVGATLQRSPGTAVEVCVTLLTAAQLEALGETERSYTLEELRDLDLELEGGARLDRAHAYVSRHAALVLDGAEVALAAIPATGRRFEARTEPQTLAAVARRLGHRGDLDDFILAAVDDPELAAARTRELRRDARPLDWPGGAPAADRPRGNPLEESGR
ncbi:MAG: hypothetical protein M3088_01130 [Actinomycetota bacterium]|nr:hypothetical protein [Actinomycetota bacterium]